jgi:hypothetical protein
MIDSRDGRKTATVHVGASYPPISIWKWTRLEEVVMHIISVTTKAWMQQSVQWFLCGDVMLRHFKARYGCRTPHSGSYRMEHCVLMKAVTYCQNRIFIGTISTVLRSHVDIESDGGLCVCEWVPREMLCIRSGWCEDVQQQWHLCTDGRMIVYVRINLATCR